MTNPLDLTEIEAAARAALELRKLASDASACERDKLADEVKRLQISLNHESYCHDKAAQDRTKAEQERDNVADEVKRLERERSEYRNCFHDALIGYDKLRAELSNFLGAFDEYFRRVFPEAGYYEIEDALQAMFSAANQARAAVGKVP